jgi:hypothetical protein
LEGGPLDGYPSVIGHARQSRSKWHGRPELPLVARVREVLTE